MLLAELETRFSRPRKFRNAGCVARALSDVRDYNREVMVVFCLDAARRAVSREIVGIGTLDACLVHAREVFRTAIVRESASVILGHNHPSGSLEPSEDDIDTTCRIRDAGEIVGIPLIDHVIVGRNSRRYYSFREDGRWLGF